MTLSVQTDMGLTLHDDPHRLTQLFANRMENSLRYTEPAGQTEITARYRAKMLRLISMVRHPAGSGRASTYLSKVCNVNEKQILVVEDEPKIARLLIDYLDASGYGSHWITDGNAVVDYVRSKAPDLLLLDIKLPGKDGMSICREIRTFSSVPMIMLTARAEEVDRLLGLELGADDYVCKPFSPREVMARIKAIFRRLDAGDGDQETGFTIDPDRQQIRYRGQLLALTPKEYRLLALLAKKPGRIYSRDRLLDELGAEDRDVSDRAIDSQIKNLRKKLTTAAPEQNLIQSVYGVGYKLEP